MEASLIVSRRAFLAGAGAALLSSRARASGAGVLQPVALDWVSAQNLLALSLVPLGVPEKALYRQIVVEPVLPSKVAEIGLRSQPNLELVASWKPDLLITGGEMAPMRERLETIAPLVFFDPDQSREKDLLAAGSDALADLAARLGAQQEFEGFMASMKEEFAAAAKRLADYDGRPVFIASVIDGQRLLVFGRNSLFQDVLDRFGIENAWSGFTSRYGHATVTADRLVDRREARLLCVGSGSDGAMERLLAAPVIASLPFVKERRISLIPEVLFYGGLPSARRFVRLASMALAGENAA